MYTVQNANCKVSTRKKHFMQFKEKRACKTPVKGLRSGSSAPFMFNLLNTVVLSLFFKHFCETHICSYNLLVNLFWVSLSGNCYMLRISVQTLEPSTNEWEACRNRDSAQGQRAQDREQVDVSKRGRKEREIHTCLIHLRRKTLCQPPESHWEWWNVYNIACTEVISSLSTWYETLKPA